ncbi:MAG: zinc-binding dehydrogenase [Actinobacteria bacterium]|nr:zinc-binding dehydrogenase [Actinomycetota bacterium]
MATKARVIVAPPDAPMQVVETELPAPGPGMVVVEQFASGICHSQLHQLHRARREGLLLGHESTGRVVAVGAGVGHVAVGDTVLVTWVPRSPAAAASWSGGVALDLPGGRAATADCFTWATHTLVHEQLVVRADAGIAPDVTSIIGCAVMTGAGAVLHTADVQAGQSVAVFGVGGVGLSAIAAARVRGAELVIAVDLDDEKLAFARRFGATHGVNARAGDPVEQIRAITREYYGAGRPERYEGLGFRGMPIEGVDVALDCIGLKVTMEQIVPATRPGRFGVNQGGVAVLVGVPSTTVELDASHMLLTEKSFRGSIGGSCTPDVDFPEFLAWHADGRLPLDELVTARFRLDEVNEACAALERGEISGRAIFELA